MNDDLKAIFANVNDWLKYAETKNATLVAFNGASIFGLLQAWSVVPSHEIIFIDVILLAFSALLSIISFVPRLSTVLSNKKYGSQEWNNAKNIVNILYFDDLSKLSSAQFVELYELRINGTFHPVGIDLNLIDQIIINSEIAIKKNRWFGLSVRISILTILFNMVYACHLAFGWFNI
ncbi:Pycsar system effector family protein [Fibrella forsythiae]|uniref:Pycsar effector protein domain-containing protein n=1 Tax=Fibrella forsythiae TaxID=2817061 RepID=A0ABS3JBA5_9BACT|nr:Pycsar system effector family protein [Fibrella forsythiae]MBO0947271.1 hypothetical protein [Fibrella forsythiae]